MDELLASLATLEQLPGRIEGHVSVAPHTGGSDPMTFKVSGPSAQHLRELTSGLGRKA